MIRLLATAAVLAALTTPADARPLYLKHFVESYPKVGEAAKAKKCGVCHPVKSKKVRNDYGIAVGKLTGENQKDAKKIVDALAAAETVQNSDGKTFASLIEAGKLPGGWAPLFNGKDLEGWIPKIRHREAGENYGETFYVEDGLLKVRYDTLGYYKEFDEQFGHLFYEEPFSKYRLRVEYRFVGDQCPGGPGWATRNSGVMIHGELADQMTKDQDFPASIEVQLLGGDGKKDRPTSNLCTPGTHVVMDGKLLTRHCTNSTSKTYHGDQWVTAEIEVNGSGAIKHVLDGKVVLEYQQPQLDDSPHSKMLAEKRGGKLLDSGSISLQSESHPCDFRKVEILILD